MFGHMFGSTKPFETQEPAKTTTVGLKPSVVSYISGQGPTSRSRFKVPAPGPSSRSHSPNTKKLHLFHDHPRRHRRRRGRYRRLRQLPKMEINVPRDKVDVPIHVAPITLWPRHQRRRLGRCRLLRNHRGHSHARYLAGNKPGSIFLNV